MLAQVSGKKESLKLKKHIHELLDQCINKSYPVSNLTGHHRRTNKHYSKADGEKNPIALIELPN